MNWFVDFASSSFSCFAWELRTKKALKEETPVLLSIRDLVFLEQIKPNQVHHSLCQPLDLTEVLYTALLSHQRTQSLSRSQHPAFIKVRLSSLTEIFLEIFIFLGWSKPLLRTDLPSPQWQSWLQAKTKPGLFLVILGLVFSRPLNPSLQFQKSLWLEGWRLSVSSRNP